MNFFNFTAIFLADSLVTTLHTSSVLSLQASFSRDNLWERRRRKVNEQFFIFMQPAVREQRVKWWYFFVLLLVLGVRGVWTRYENISLSWLDDSRNFHSRSWKIIFNHLRSTLPEHSSLFADDEVELDGSVHVRQKNAINFFSLRYRWNGFFIAEKYSDGVFSPLKCR